MAPFKIWFRAYKSVFFQALLFLIAAGIIFIFLPSESKFKYEYRQGAPWFNEDLIAPFSFPIYKSEFEIAADKDSLTKHYPLFFYVDTLAVDISTRALQNQITKSVNLIISQNLAEVPEDYYTQVSILLQRFSEYLSSGILDTAFSRENQNRTIHVVYKSISSEYLGKEIPQKRSSRLQFRRLSQRILGQTPWVETMIRLIPQSYTEISTLEYDSVLTQINLNKMREEISLTRGMVQEGQRIVSRGEVISEQTFKVLESLRIEYTAKDRDNITMIWILTGKILISLIATTLLFLFLTYSRRRIKDYNAKVIFVLFLSLISVAIAHFVSKDNATYIYLVPWVIVPVILRVFFDTRLAILIFSSLIVIMGWIVPNPYEFVFTNFIVGIVSVFTLSIMYQRSRIFLVAISVLASYSIIYTSISLMQDGNIYNLDPMRYVWYVGNSLLILWSYPLIYMFEKVFGFLSDVTLMEVANTNSSILRKLNERAPGTFQHSLQVANMAESAIRIIGGNPMLVRAGALYHDIGKINMPQYFIENQTGNINPHDKLTPEQSAGIIVSHVKKGVEIAKKNKIPGAIVDFIISHHGTSVTQYFYRTFIVENPGKTPNINKFQYKGTLPTSKEQAVVMLADSVEAAGRTLKNYTQQSVSNLTDKIIDGIVAAGLMKAAELTFKDIDTIKEVFKKKLLNIYHLRVEYPENPLDD